MINKKIPVWYVPGNHDIGQSPTRTDIEKFAADYGHDRFSFKHKESTFIGINSCIIKSGNATEEELQMKWLTTELDKAGTSNHILVFTHYPFFINTPDEAETYSNLSPAKRDTYFTLFNQKGVEAVFAGHLHNNGAGKSGNVEMITTNAVAKSNGKGPSGIRVIKVYPDRIESVFYGIDEIPGIITFAEKKQTP
jgi:3',5'-cyclic AMP phosphodiesterase CpdA